MHSLRNPPVQAEIDAIEEPRIPLTEELQRLLARAGKALLLPDLVEPAGIALIALAEVLAPYPEPSRNPDVDGIGAGKGAVRLHRDGREGKFDGHHT